MSDHPFLESCLYKVPASGTGELERYIPYPERRAPGYLAGQFRQILLGVMTEVLEPARLTAAQWGVLVALAKEPGIDQRRLSERRSIDPNSASRLVDELEELALVRRQAAPDDRRANVLELTVAGKKKYARLRPAVLAAQDRVLAPLQQAEKRTFLDLLTRVVAGNQAYARPGNGRRRPVRKSPEALPSTGIPSGRRSASIVPTRCRGRWYWLQDPVSVWSHSPTPSTS
ncbi:MAG: winged helix-turn-helix transcriptional regulator [Betaproteobacteria bacterium]|nr:winged helix-turn-helix transcriptional regulator [Betaproteobacteria bacterium]